MIFDNAKIEKLYCTYIATKDRKLVEQMHTHTTSLIKVIAGSIDQGPLFGDLVQEGHLKLQRVIVELKFTPGKASLYTFLSMVLRNSMVDYMRKLRDYEPLSDSLIDPYNSPCAQYDYIFDLYYQRRFPSLADSYNASAYVKDAIIESSRKANVITTLECTHNLSRPRATIVFNSVEVFLRAAIIMSLEEHHLIKPLSYATNGKEFTLFPEGVLIGLEQEIVLYNQLIARVKR